MLSVVPPGAVLSKMVPLKLLLYTKYEKMV